MIKTVGHCELKCGIINLRVYSDEFLRGRMIFLNLQLWRQVKTKPLKVPPEMNHLDPLELAGNV